VAALRSAGFDDVACYRRWPRSARLPVFWIPLDAPVAAAYVRSRARLRGGRTRRLLAEAGRRAQDLARGRPGGTLCAIARRSGARSGHHAPADWLQDAWEGWSLGPAPDRLSVLLVTGGPRTVSKVVLLAFAEPDATPIVAVKAARVEAAAEGVRREAAALEAVGRRGASGVPRLLLQREVGVVPVVAETALVGRPLESLLGSRNLAAWSGKVADWLAALGQGGPVRQAADWREAIVEPTLARFKQSFGAVVDPALLREGEALARAVGDLPSVPEQRDFGPWNVLATPAGGIAVLDWESAEVAGLPALDLLYYLAYASFSADRAWDRESRIASFARSLDPSSRTGTVRRDCLARYAGALGLDAAQLAPLRALVWLIHTHSDFRHASADAGGPPSVDALANSLFLALWTAEMRNMRRR
jgi:hypothetical protein